MWSGICGARRYMSSGGLNANDVMIRMRHSPTLSKRVKRVQAGVDFASIDRPRPDCPSILSARPVDLIGSPGYQTQVEFTHTTSPHSQSCPANLMSLVVEAKPHLQLENQSFAIGERGIVRDSQSTDQADTRPTHRAVDRVHQRLERHWYVFLTIPA